jgi:hypothetical protein
LGRERVEGRVPLWTELGGVNGGGGEVLGAREEVRTAFIGD